MAGYLKQSGCGQWLPMVWIGVGFACLLCLAIGAALNAANREFPQRQQEMCEGFVALFATAILEEYVTQRLFLRSSWRSIGRGVPRRGLDRGDGVIPGQRAAASA